MLLFIAALCNKQQHKHSAPILYMTTPHEQRRLNDANGLLFVYQFGWLRTAELGKLLWPDSPASRQSADRLARAWIERQLVIVRKLPDGAGRALVLATAGVRLLAENNIAAGIGKDIGRHTADGWLPPASWRHDLIAHGALCELHRLGYQVYPEMELRRHAGNHPKIPDGFAVKGGEGIWLEVEHARKSGKEMRRLADALSIAADGQAASIAGLKPNAAMVAFLPSAVDERGHILSHQTRVRNAIQAVAKNDLSIYWAKCTLIGSAGVGKVDIQQERIGADYTNRILKILDARGWHENQDGDGVYSTYNKHITYVWEDEHGWCYSVDTIDGKPIEANRADNITSAKRAAASVLAQL
ncbi:hypothetical protein [Janthinobacterium sp. 1_2014MBL_MicDiv]|uniref:hypothetical protein n=1 Tax=Janthinobacterium sp. 1_2014MBL_MicDiv TaxID=1644131 RepID=UPI0012EB1F74|nr:hypothetical protein [Janthinobacterium sp. 1_2014MBL_MicDiv]